MRLTRSDIGFAPKPVQKPHPPIWIPSQGSTETVVWAAALSILAHFGVGLFLIGAGLFDVGPGNSDFFRARAVQQFLQAGFQGGRHPREAEFAKGGVEFDEIHVGSPVCWSMRSR